MLTIQRNENIPQNNAIRVKGQTDMNQNENKYYSNQVQKITIELRGY